MSHRGAVPLLRRLLLHERIQMAAKAAVAAALAWFAAEILTSGSELESYQYYAPLGALVAVQPTVAASLRSSVEAVLSIATGGVIGLAVHGVLDPGLGALAVGVFAGVLAGGLPWLGTSRSWVPVVALFVLLVGGQDPWTYSLAYVLLALLGAVLAVGVNVAVPALRLSQGRTALVRAQDLLADQLTDLAAGLRQHPAPSRQEWARRRRDIDPAVDAMRSAVAEMLQARRGNPRARWHTTETDRQQRAAHGLARVAVLVEDLVAAFGEYHRGDLPTSPLDDDLAATTAEALEDLAAVVRDYLSPMDPDDERVVAVEQRIQAVTDEFARRRDLDPVDLAVLGGVVANLRRALATVRPAAGTAASDDAASDDATSDDAASDNGTSADR